MSSSSPSSQVNKTDLSDLTVVQICNKIHFLTFEGLPDVELGINDLPRQGKEVVGRHDIIPVITEEWIRLEDVEFHGCIDQEEYQKTRTVK